MTDYHPLLRKNQYSSSFEFNQSYRSGFSELSITDPSALQITKIKKDYLINFSQLRILDEIKEKRTKFALGKVKRALFKGEQVVCRQISPLHMTNWLAEDFCTDASISIKMASFLPIIPVLGYGEKQGKLYLVMPLWQNLYSRLHQQQEEELSFLAKIELMLKIAQALHSIHQAVVSISLQEELTAQLDRHQVRIGDVNLLKVKKNALIFDGYRIKNVWSSPQVFKHNFSEILSSQVDVYSYGLVCWEMLTKQIPFDGKVSKASEFVVQKNKRPYIPQETPETIKSIIRASWNANRELRPKLNEIIEKLTQFLNESR